MHDFATIYAVSFVIVYFAQTTTVRLEILTPQASQILDFNKGGLFLIMTYWDMDLWYYQLLFY